MQDGFNPGGGAGIGDELDVKLDLAVEGGGVGAAVAVHKVAGVVHFKAVHAKEPLIDLHLALVADLPVGIQCYLTVLRRGLVIDDQQLTLGIDPHVIYSTGKAQVGAGQIVGDTAA